jgi:hypothetical protein
VNPLPDTQLQTQSMWDTEALVDTEFANVDTESFGK